jgi:hypothetical protein
LYCSTKAVIRGLKLAGQIIVLQQNVVLQGLMPTLNLALRLRVAEGAVNIFDAVVLSNRASSASVFSPLTADSATFALKAGLWLRWVRFVMCSPDAVSSPRSGRISTYRTVQNSPATSQIFLP